MPGAPGSELELFRSLIDATRLLMLIVDARGEVIRVNRAVEEVTGLAAKAFRVPIWQLAALPDERLLLKERFAPLNEAFLELVGYTREELPSGAISWREITPAEYRHLDDRALAALEATGKCTPYEKEYVARGGERVPVLIGAASFGASEPGRQEGVAFILDLREQVRLRAARDGSLAKEQAARIDTELANARLLLLVQGSRRLARTMTIDDTLTVLSELVVPSLADWSYVAHRGRNGGPCLVAAACSDPNKRALVRRLRACSPDLEAPEGVAGVFRTGEPAVFEDLTPEQVDPRMADWSVVGTRDPEQLAVIRELGMASLPCAFRSGAGPVWTPS